MGRQLLNSRQAVKLDRIKSALSFSAPPAPAPVPARSQPANALLRAQLHVKKDTAARYKAALYCYDAALADKRLLGDALGYYRWVLDSLRFLWDP